MKKILFVFTCLASLASCTVKSNEEKARELIEPIVKASLIKPESFELAELRLDSCFTDDPERNADVVALGIKLAEQYKDYKDNLADADDAESYMSIYAPSYGYSSAHSKVEYRQYKEKMEIAKKKANAAKENIVQLFKDNQKLLENLNSRKHEFTGWMAICSYRAETAGGMKTIGKRLLFLNKDMTEVTLHLDEEDMLKIKNSGIEDAKYELGDELKDLFVDK